MELEWLPETSGPPATPQHLSHLSPSEASPSEAAVALRRMASTRLDLPGLIKLDRTLTRTLAAHGGPLPGFEKLRLAVLGSSTTSHLLPGIRVAGLRRGLLLEIYETPYNSYRQELENQQSPLHHFFPQAILFALDAHTLAAIGSAEAALEHLRDNWRLAGDHFPAQLLQQTALPVLPTLLGSNEDRLASSPAAILDALNGLLRPAAADAGVDLLAVDRFALHDGLKQWHDPALWYRAKQEIHPSATALYGDHVARLLGAARGRSAKALVLDLDGTLWGGGIGDDGLEGLVLGPGSAAGEAHLAVQEYALALRQRGVLLAVCSKNEEHIALQPFLRHPEMRLRREHIAVFIANWTDKATNLRRIAAELNLGLDVLVFLDDNPAERALIRRELPEVHVPELPDDPALFVPTLAGAGYFEATYLTAEDRNRATGYTAAGLPQGNTTVDKLPSRTDLNAYLTSLDMTLTAQPIDELSLRRVTQLLNKTNQFNLTTRRRTEAEIRAQMLSPEAWLTLACRLTDRFTDHGLIAVITARRQPEKQAGQPPAYAPEAVIEDWLMSCRVLGRGVEHACLNLLAADARARGIRRLIGLYRPTTRNTQVSDLYARLGFELLAEESDGATRWSLDLSGFQPRPTPVLISARVANTFATAP